MAEHPHAAHPSIHHHKQAARHHRAAADRHEEAIAHHERGEHATAAELAKQADGHAGEAQAHAVEARRLHERQEAQELE